MDKRIAIVIIFSLTVAVSASYFVYAMLVRHMGPQAGKGDARAIVAVQDLPLGSVIHETDLAYADVASPVAGNPARKEDLIGRGVINGIYKGEPILEGRLSEKGAGGGLAGLIRHGMRAAAVRVNEVVGVSGFVRPGMHVDVITSGSPPDFGQRSGGTISRIVLQNLEVLSAGQDLDRDKEGKAVAVQVVNLLVSPEQAEILTLASNDSKVQLILRNPLDTEITKTTGINTAAMFNAGDFRPPPPAPVAYRSVRPAGRPAPAPAAVATGPRPILVEVVNGSKRETITVGYRNSSQAGLAQ